jgi:hypothetical protein
VGATTTSYLIKLSIGIIEFLRFFFFFFFFFLFFFFKVNYFTEISTKILIDKHSKRRS